MAERYIVDPSSASAGNSRRYQPTSANTNLLASRGFVPSSRYSPTSPLVTVNLQGVDTWASELRTINQRLENIERVLSQLIGDNNEHEQRKITDQEAKAEVKAYYERHDGEDIFPDQVASDLNLDIIQVIRVCEELVAEGKLNAGHP